MMLILLTLAVMRLASWFFYWISSRLLRRDSIRLRLFSNLVAFCIFAAFLYIDRLPGEFLDIRAFIFGLLVFGFYCAVDCRWLPRFVKYSPR